MRKMVANGEADALVLDRVWKETEAALAGPNPRLYFEALRVPVVHCVSFFLKSMRLFGIPQPAQWHPEIDTGLHTMMVRRSGLKSSVSDDIEVRFAALVHDIGKGTTKPY